MGSGPPNLSGVVPRSPVNVGVNVPVTDLSIFLSEPFTFTCTPTFTGGKLRGKDA